LKDKKGVNMVKNVEEEIVDDALKIANIKRKKKKRTICCKEK